MTTTATSIDAHLHYWDRAMFDYPWLDDAPALPTRFLPEDRQGGHARVQGVVFVQADCLPEHGLAEARWAADLVGDRGAVVAFAPIEDADIAAWLEGLGAVGRVRGVRRLLQDASPELFESEGLRRGLRDLAPAGLAFDACVRWHQLPDLVRLRRAAPDTVVVLDHLGKPPIRAGWGSSVAVAWHAAIRELAREPRTYVKVSGLAPEAGPGPLRPQLAPFVEAALDAFGAERTMIGSDFPVSAAPSNALSFDEWTEFVLGFAGSERERRCLAGGAAAEVYRLSAVC